MPYRPSCQKAVRELRCAMRYSQEKMARFLDVSIRTVHRFENDAPPTGEWLIRLAEIARDYGRHDLMQAFYAELGRHFTLYASRGILVQDSGAGYYLTGIRTKQQARLLKVADTLMRRIDDPNMSAFLAQLEKLMREMLTALIPIIVLVPQ